MKLGDHHHACWDNLRSIAAHAHMLWTAWLQPVTAFTFTCHDFWAQGHKVLSKHRRSSVLHDLRDSQRGKERLQTWFKQTVM